MIRKLLGVVLALGLMAMLGCAMAEEVFDIWADQLQMERLNDSVYLAEKLTAATQYIRINCQLAEENTPVKLAVKRLSDGKTVHQKNYGKRSGVFVSDEIYLKYAGGAADYEITLITGETQWQFPFYRKLMRLSHNNACTYGVRIREVAPGVTKGWQMATVVDVNGGNLTVPLCASDQYVIGEARINISGDSLSVHISPRQDIALTVHKEQLYAITEPGALTSLESSGLKKHRAFKTGEPLSISEDLGGSQYVILYLSMEVSYDPNGLERFSYDASRVKEQVNLWKQLKENGGIESLG